MEIQPVSPGEIWDYNVKLHLHWQCGVIWDLIPDPRVASPVMHGGTIVWIMEQILLHLHVNIWQGPCYIALTQQLLKYFLIEFTFVVAGKCQFTEIKWSSVNILILKKLFVFSLVDHIRKKHFRYVYEVQGSLISSHSHAYSIDEQKQNSHV